MNVPVLDLKAQYAALAPQVDAALKRVCENAWFKLGPEVERFERDWAAYCETEQCVAVNSGTSALHLALLALGVGRGDEVITSPFSFFATAEVILYVGATPVFVDIAPETYCLDPARVEEALTTRTRALMPVHLFGHPADMDPILTLAREHGLAVIEDAAQAHGALYKGRKAGSLGDAAAFSFYPTKNLGAYGEAGAVTTGDEAVAERMRLLRNHGQSGGYYHSVVGYNYRMEGVQGAVLNVKLPHLDAWNARRREIAARYAEELAETPLGLPSEAGYARSAWHQYVLRCDERDALKAHLERAGIAAVVYYPAPMTQFEALADLDIPPADVPEAERACREVLSPPIYAEMTDGQVDYVIETIRGFFGL